MKPYKKVFKEATPIEVKAYTVLVNNWAVGSFYTKKDAERCIDFYESIQLAGAFFNKTLKIKEDNDFINLKNYEILRSKRIELEVIS